MKKLPIMRGSKWQPELAGFSLVDDEDYWRFITIRWSLNATGYAIRWFRDPRSGRNTWRFLHREIMDLEKGDPLQVDHINHDRLDNRRSNLRVVTEQVNHQNVRSLEGSSSRFRGVMFHKASQKWMARVKMDGRSHYLGLFLDEDAAGRAASEFRSLHMPGAIEASL